MADIKNVPEVIYLQVDPDDEWLDGIPGEDVDFLDLAEVTWCVDRIGITDVKYIRFTSDMTAMLSKQTEETDV